MGGAARGWWLGAGAGAGVGWGGAGMGSCFLSFFHVFLLPLFLLLSAFRLACTRTSNSGRSGSAAVRIIPTRTHACLRIWGTPPSADRLRLKTDGARRSALPAHK